ncbi:putative membrane protein YfcA [Enterococcus sp. UD-01]
MIIAVLYFCVIIFANTIGAVSGMGGGVLIKPIFDLIGAHSVEAISFYSTVAVFTMSVVSTTRQLKLGTKFDWKIVGWLSAGSVLGGILGNVTFERLLAFFSEAFYVQLLQIALTIATLIFAFLFVKYEFKTYMFTTVYAYLLCGMTLGFLASLLGIGGGPINVALLMLLFSFPIKDATVYSICIIFCSQLAKLVTIATMTGFERYDLSMLLAIIPAAVIGGLFGAQLSNLLTEKKVALVFQGVVFLVLMINLYNGWKILF